MKMDEIHKKIKKMTLGTLLNCLRIEDFNEDLDQLLSDAKDSRNRLTHYFHLQVPPQFREGREVMLRDLETSRKFW